MNTGTAASVLALAVTCCRHPTPNTDAVRIRGARDALYAAIAAYDSASIRAAVAPEYVLIEDGALWNVDSLISAVMGLRRDGLQIAYGFDGDSVRVQGALAWLTYRNQGILSGPRGADTLHWIESAVFRKDRGSWRMALLHSTRVRGGP